MLSSRFAVSIRPDPVLNAQILAAAFAAIVAGLLIIATLPVLPAARFVAAIAWLAGSACGLQRYRADQARYRELRFAIDHQWRGLCLNGIWHPLTRQTGTRVGRRFVWLRLADSAGHRLVFALRPRSVTVEEWRRLQVILRYGRR